MTVEDEYPATENVFGLPVGHDLDADDLVTDVVVLVRFRNADQGKRHGFALYSSDEVDPTVAIGLLTRALNQQATADRIMFDQGGNDG